MGRGILGRLVGQAGNSPATGPAALKPITPRPTGTKTGIKATPAPALAAPTARAVKTKDRL